MNCSFSSYETVKTIDNITGIVTTLLYRLSWGAKLKIFWVCHIGRGQYSRKGETLCLLSCSRNLTLNLVGHDWHRVGDGPHSNLYVNIEICFVCRRSPSRVLGVPSKTL